MTAAALINNVKHARLLSAIARGITRTNPREAPRAIAVEVLAELLAMPREVRVEFAAELIKPDRTPAKEEDDKCTETTDQENRPTTRPTTA